MKKIGFVIPWFGWDIPGGAEAELRGLVSHLAASGQEVEILTTCVKQFASDWSVNYHKAKTTVERGVTIRRFKVDKRNKSSFAEVNRKLMANELPLTAQEEAIYAKEMVNSQALYNYLLRSQEEYGLYVFIPYMFGTTYNGIQQCFDKSVLIPCLHDESYIYMDIFKKAFSRVRGMIFHAQPEHDLACRVYDLSNVETAVLGEGVDTDWEGDGKRFRNKYHIEDPFILYAGRKDVGKNIHSLIYQFAEYKNAHDTNLKLVLIGGGKVDIPDDIKDEVYDLGFVDQQDKFDAYGAAMVLCQPSKNESFSLVIMESWLCGRPVLVHDSCLVTRHFAEISHGGLYFANYYEFEKAIDFYLEHPRLADEMGRQGRQFVMENFAWDVIVRKYLEYFRKVAGENVGREDYAGNHMG